MRKNFFTAGVAALALVAFAGTAAAQNAARPPAPPTKEDEGVRFLKGAIDMHWHMDPLIPGAGDRQYARGTIDTVRIAAQKGMRALQIKDHYEPTSGLAYAIRQQIKEPGFTVFGGVVMNLTNGGENPAAVEFMATQIEGNVGKVVWMPAGDSEIESRIAPKPGKPFVHVSENGVLTAQTRAVIADIAKYNLILATGHIAPEEAMLVLAEGKRAGVKHMIVTHAMDLAGHMTPAQIDQALQYGPTIEFDYRNIFRDNGVRAAEIKKIGAQNCLISEFWTNTAPNEYGGFASIGDFVDKMHAYGFTDADLDTMVKDNPARLLDLPLLPH